MTTIILTIIGILLAAAAALMVIFYGGDAFNSGSVGAAANTYQNAGTNVISAVQMFKAENANSPASLTALASGPNGAYLDEEPALPNGATAALANDIYTVTVVADDATATTQVCDRINKNLGNAAVPTGGEKMGCIDNVFFARAGSAVYDEGE